MIKVSVGEYRHISEPYEQLFGSNNVQYEREEGKESLNIVINNKSLTQTKDIVNVLVEQFDDIFKQNRINLINKVPQISDLIISTYDSIILGEINESNITTINNYLKGQFLEDSQSLTIYDFFLYELAQALLNLNRDLYERNKNIVEFVSLYETTESIQSYTFNSKLILKPFSKQVQNIYHSIHQVVSKNIDTFADFANLENASYLFKLKLQNGEERIMTDHIPFSASPLIIQKSEFDEFYNKTQLWNQLLDKMTKNYEWVKETFKHMTDPLLQGFLKIAEKANKSEKTQKIQLGLIRNDVMHSASKHKWLQIEYNTISISFSYIAEQVQSLQQTIKNSYLKSFFGDYECFSESSVEVAVEGLKNAYDLYNKPNSQILVVVSSFEGNSYDQRYPEYLLARRHGIIVKRRTFEQLIESTHVNDDGTMFVEGDEIAVIYYRTGYSPDHFPNEKIWEIREKIELTQAIKCPSVNLILVGFKKLQKTLQEPGQMEQFLSEEECKQIKENFANIYDFEDEEKQEELLQLAKNDPDHYILKPQREGGDNNTYGKAIYPYLQSLSVSERKNYILMEKIIPKPSISYMIRNRKLEVVPSISELGIISYFISDQEKILHNKTGGYLIRTKRYFDNEGGVNAGYSVIDGLMVKKQTN